MEPDILGFKTDFETDSGKKFLVLTKEGLTNNEIIGFQVEMIAKNRIPGVAGLNAREKDLEIKLWYDISGLVTLSNFFKRQKVSKSDFTLILKNITTTLIECKNYLLNDRFFILDENVVYINPESLQTHLVYIPCDRKTELTTTFRNFALNLIINAANIDARDNFVQILLQEIKKDDFCLEGFRRNLDKLNREKTSGDSSFTVINETDSGLSPKQGLSLQPDAVIVPKDIDGQKPPSPVKPNASGNGFYLFVIIASVLVLAAVKLRTQYLLPGSATGINIDTAGIGILVLILTVVLGLVTYSKLIQRFSHKDCKTICTVPQVNGHDDIYPNGCADVQTRADRLPDTNPSVPALSSPIYPLAHSPVLTYTDETVLLNDEKPSPRLVSVNTGETIVINKPEFIVGRNGETCDYAIDHKSVGRAHAIIKCENAKYYIIDMDSRNGTYLNGTRLLSNKHYELKGNDVVVFANIEFYFK